MPITSSLFPLTIEGVQYAFAQGDISFGDGETQDIPLNLSTAVETIQTRKREVTFTARGVNANKLQALYAARDNAAEQLATATEPVVGTDMTIGADTLYSMILVSVTAEAPILLGDNSITNVTIVYRSTVFVV